MEEMSIRDEVAGARATDSSEASTASQSTGEDLAGTVLEAFGTGSENCPPCKSPLISCADGFDEATFKICKELFRPYKKSLQKLHFHQHLSTEKQLKYVKENLTVIGDQIDQFLQLYCKSSEVKLWQKMLWQFVSLFSEKDAEQLQKLYKYIKNNEVYKFKQLCCSENPNSDPGLKEEKLKEPCIKEHLDHRHSHHQHTQEVTTQHQHDE